MSFILRLAEVFSNSSMWKKENRRRKLNTKKNVIKLGMFLAVTLEMVWVQPHLSKHLCQQCPNVLPRKVSHPAARDSVLPITLLLNSYCLLSPSRVRWTHRQYPLGTGTGNPCRLGRTRGFAAPLLHSLCWQTAHSHILHFGPDLYSWFFWVLHLQTSSSKTHEFYQKR